MLFLEFFAFFDVQLKFESLSLRFECRIGPIRKTVHLRLNPDIFENSVKGFY